MSIGDVLKNMGEEDRLLYLSATQIRGSAFWRYLIKEIEELAEVNTGEMLLQTMRGNTKEALIAACKIQGLHFAKETMESIIRDVETSALNQEQEEENANTD